MVDTYGVFTGLRASSMAAFLSAVSLPLTSLLALLSQLFNPFHQQPLRQQCSCHECTTIWQSFVYFTMLFLSTLCFTMSFWASMHKITSLMVLQNTAKSSFYIFRQKLGPSCRSGGSHVIAPLSENATSVLEYQSRQARGSSDSGRAGAYY